MEIGCGVGFFLGFNFPVLSLFFPFSLSTYAFCQYFRVRVLVSDLHFFASEETTSSGSATQVSIEKWEWKRRD